MDKFLEILKSVGINFESFSGLTSISYGPGWLLSAFGAVALSVFGISMGRTKAVISLFSLYVAFAINWLFPYFEELESVLKLSLGNYWMRMALFVFTYIVTFIIFNLSFVRRRLSSAEFSLISVMILSFLQLGLMLSILLSFIPKDIAQGWFFGIYPYFGSSQALFLWAIAPLPVLPFLRAK